MAITPETKAPKIRVLLVDDHPVVREGLRSILSSFEQLAIVGEAASGAQALVVSRELNPDVIVMDISMPDMSGIEATAALSREMPACKVLALTMHDNPSYVTQILRAGARGYILKHTPPKELVEAICEVFEGANPVSPRAADILLNKAFPGRAPHALSPREIQVLSFIARGFTNKDIGLHLKLSVRTVETYRENLIRKTGRSTVAELTRYAMTQGLAEVSEPQS
jgi:two-component system nitrate/nitrite response regulator NarL